MLELTIRFILLVALLASFVGLLTQVFTLCGIVRNWRDPNHFGRFEYMESFYLERASMLIKTVTRFLIYGLLSVILYLICTL